MRIRSFFGAVAVSLVLLPNLATAQDHEIKYDTLSASERDQAVRQVKNLLKDPDSARFRWLPRIHGDLVYCGLVNAKNSYGGYTGYVLWLGRITTDAEGTSTIKVVDIANPPPAASRARTDCRLHGYDRLEPEVEVEG